MAQAAIRREGTQSSKLISKKIGTRRPGQTQARDERSHAKAKEIQLLKPVRRASKKRATPLAARLGMLFMITVAVSLFSLFTYMQHQTLILETVKFPCRIITCAISGVVGAVNGGINGVIRTEAEVASQTFAKADEDPFLIPAGIVGVAIAVPVGVAIGVPADVISYGQAGYHWWDSV